MSHAASDEDPARIPAPAPAGLRDDPASALRRLSGSRFRSRFRMLPADVAYARSRGREVIERHASDLLAGRIGPASPRNDGRQTPMRGHPVFLAQHATATCCRGCLSKWHGVPEGRPLSDRELDGAVALVMAWIEEQLRRSSQPG